MRSLGVAAFHTSERKRNTPAAMSKMGLIRVVEKSILILR
jgi:hypothetical protein